MERHTITDIIFDFFGTLVHYSQSWDSTSVNSSYEYLCTLGFKMEKQVFIDELDRCFMYLTKEAIKDKTEFHMYDFGRYFFKQCFDYSISDKENKEFIDKNINDWNANVVYFPDIAGFIDKLSKKFRLSILSNTNYPDLIHRNLENMNLKGCFYKVYTSVEIGIKKPNKEIFEHVLHDLNTNSSNTIFVGDSYNDDYLGAKTVDMKCYLIDKDNRYNNVISTRIASLFELAEIAEMK